MDCDSQDSTKSNNQDFWKSLDDTEVQHILSNDPNSSNQIQSDETFREKNLENSNSITTSQPANENFSQSMECDPHVSNRSNYQDFLKCFQQIWLLRKTAALVSDGADRKGGVAS